MTMCQGWFRALLLASMATTTISLPFDLTFSGGSLCIHAFRANAKDGNNGGGNGIGGGNGNGGGNGSRGASANADGNGSGSSGDGASNSNANSGANGPETGASKTSSQPPGDPAAPNAAGPINVQHANGFTEAVKNGRYVMKDSRGRVVVDRRARLDDVRRLKGSER